MNRVAIIGGCRTPFVKAGGVFAQYSFLDLGLHVVQALLKRLKLDPASIDELVYSTVLLNARTPNAARELVLRSSLSKRTPAHFVSNNCISGLVALNFAAEGIRSGRISSALAGGSESMSRPTLTLKPQTEALFLELARAKTAWSKITSLLRLRPTMFLPQAPSPKEPSTGLTMGEHCELTTKEFGIARTAQDEFALKSHLNAAKAKDFLSEEIEPLDQQAFDNIIRPTTTLEQLAKLKPVFDRGPAGTLTAGNSSPLTDGASIVCLMSEQEAERRALPILGFIEGVEFSAIDPSHGLLMAPGLAVPKLLRRLNLSVSAIDLFEIHEAFAAQVLATLQVWDEGWKKYPDLKSIGKIPSERINVNGGSIAIGHPFAATGGRLIVSALNQLKRSKQKRALISVCAAGAMGCALTLVRD